MFKIKTNKETIHIIALSIAILFFVPFAFALTSISITNNNITFCYACILIEIISILVSLITVD